ncbi:ABC1 kinase family protein [Blastococcus mobilis]|uniref:Predicted unusual protein kinase regulating ubiquinone biosynthesis, AarF/ABC1/UbiB family n=1 Tax=Blastococcus mobilis TaxID=1938746 RepID=A0A238XEH6_9ACTN|nr:AarF/ABC1/UbiB kinase family protein [Blastococcus mobilis]SNR56329.1 Predicted unusual protein kinase regulating ubiquinone biosynthesis, AarF/ABC1/UbiB family [Blastococcus mobilis]
MTSPENGRPTRSRLARTVRLAALPAAYAGRTAVGIGKRIGGRPAEVVAAQVQQRTAEQLFATLGQLKGGAMKVGQALSAMEAALPKQLVGPYRETLIRLQESAPAMPADLVHAQLDESLGPDWRRPFRSFDDQAAAAASVGQVHRAIWSDGTPVAVKIQYPGAGEALVADIGMLQGLAPVMKAAAPGLDARELFTELRERLAEEVDYVREAEAQTAFADAYRDDPDIAVPDVLAAEGRVLITRWVDGTPLSRVIADGDQDDRDRAGQLLVRLFASGPVRAGRLHGDPHPGNFRLLPDGRLAVLDFGSTQALPDGWPARLGPLLVAGRDGDAATLHRIAASAHLLQPDKVTPEALLALLDRYLEPLRSPAYRFTRSWMQEQTRRASDPLSPAARTQRRLTIPPRHLLVQRVAVGMVGVLCSLGATVAVDAEVRRWLPGYVAPQDALGPIPRRSG